MSLFFPFSSETPSRIELQPSLGQLTSPASVIPTRTIEDDYSKYSAMRAPGKFEVLKVNSFDHPYDPVFTNRNETLLRLLRTPAYLADNPCFRPVADDDDTEDFYLVVNDEATPLVSMHLGYDLVRDPIVEFVRSLVDVSPASFAARYVVHGVTSVDADVLVTNLRMGAKLAWGCGIPFALSGLAITRDSIEKGVAHVNLNGTFLYHEKLRINNYINSYNPFRREFRVTRGCVNGSVKHFDLTLDTTNGFYVPDDCYDPDIITPLDNYMSPEDLFAIILGNTPYYSPYLCAFAGTENDLGTYFACQAARERLPPSVIRRRCVEPACNSSMAVVKDSFPHVDDIWVSSAVKKAIWQIIDADVTERQWCAMMSTIPGLADGFNAVMFGRFYYDPLASKAVACGSFYMSDKHREADHGGYRYVPSITVVSESIRDIVVDAFERQVADHTD